LFNLTYPQVTRLTANPDARVFCSRECFTGTVKRASAERNTHACASCGTLFEVNAAQRKNITAGGRVFCSRKCFNREWSEKKESLASLRAERDALRAALQRLHDNTADYVRINNLGDPYQNADMRAARDALLGAQHDQHPQA
jgi:hypothetical protein